MIWWWVRVRVVVVCSHYDAIPQCKLTGRYDQMHWIVLRVHNNFFTKDFEIVWTQMKMIISVFYNDAFSSLNQLN